jgi:hypothetical protein
MSIKMSVNGKALEYFTIKVNNGFNVEELAYLILGWESDYKKIKKIKSYSKLMNIAKKQLMDKGLIWLECPDESLKYTVEGGVDESVKQVMQHIRDVEPTKYIDKTTEEIKQLQVDKKMLEEIKQIQSEVA